MKLNNRTDKIRFLKNLKEGKASAKDLLPVKIIVWRTDGSIYSNGKVILTKELYEARQKQLSINPAAVIKISRK